MAKTRRLDVVISGEDRSAGKAFKGVGDDADKLGDHLRTAGKNAGKGFSSGVESGVDGNSLSSKLKGIGGKVSSAFKVALVAGGAVAAVAFTGAFLTELDNEFATDKLVAQLGGSEWAEDMGKIAGDLYTEGFGESVGEVGETLRKILQGGLLTEDASDAQIEALTEKVLTFVDVLDQDADMAVQALVSMLKSGIAKDGAAALDVLTRGIQQGGDKAGDLLETFQEYSTMFREIGIDADDAMGLMVQGLRGGARDADKVADALKEFGIRAQDGSELTKRGFWLIGESAKDMGEMVAGGGDRAREALDRTLEGLLKIEDPVKRNEAAVDLFGAQAEDLGDALFALDLDTAAAGLGNTAGATDKLSAAYDNAKSKIEVFKREALEKLTTFIGDEVLPRLEDFSDWVGRNEGAVTILSGVLAAFVATALLAYTVSMGQAAVATIVATWPILAIIAALAALTAGFWWAWNNSQLFRDIVMKVGFAAIIAGSQIAAAASFVWSLISAVKDAVGWVKRLIDNLNNIPVLGGGKGGGIFGTLLNAFPGGAGVGTALNLLGRADGGPAFAGVPYIVGEEGPELFVPSRSGMVIPNDLTSNLVAAETGGGGSRMARVDMHLDGHVVGSAMIDFSRDYRGVNGRDPFGG